jgi:hypothetical protein
VALYVVLLGGLVVMLARRILVGDGGPTTLVAFGLVAVITVVSLSESNLTAPGLPVLALTSGLVLNVPATTRAAPDRPLHVSTRGIEPT